MWPGHVDLRNDLDIPACGILDDVADLPFGVVAAEGARFARERRVAAESPGFRQAGIGVDLDPPPLIVGQVPVEDVRLCSAARSMIRFTSSTG